jgi:hypothetical protein
MTGRSARVAEWTGGWAVDGRFYVLRRSVGREDEWFTLGGDTVLFELSGAVLERVTEAPSCVRTFRLSVGGTSGRPCVLGVSGGWSSTRAGER